MKKEILELAEKMNLLKGLSDVENRVKKEILHWVEEYREDDEHKDSTQDDLLQNIHDEAVDGVYEVWEEPFTAVDVRAFYDKFNLPYKY